jgi:hypothetical protein
MLVTTVLCGFGTLKPEEGEEGKDVGHTKPAWYVSVGLDVMRDLITAQWPGCLWKRPLVIKEVAI